MISLFLLSFALHAAPKSHAPAAQKVNSGKLPLCAQKPTGNKRHDVHLRRQQIILNCPNVK